MGKIKKYTLIFFSLALLFPSVASLNHIFAHEKHEVCSNYAETHYHKDTLDCELCDLHAGSFAALIPVNYSFFTTPTTLTKTFNYYSFLKHYSQLSFALRGPPAVTSA